MRRSEESKIEGSKIQNYLNMCDKQDQRTSMIFNFLLTFAAYVVTIYYKL